MFMDKTTSIPVYSPAKDEVIGGGRGGGGGRGWYFI